MDDMLKTETADEAIRICRAMEDAGVKNVVGLSLGPQCSWASYLMIGTTGSRVHMHGAAADVRKTMKDLGMVFSGGKKTDDENWLIIDGGSSVVSLMSAESREFYALEERWF